MTPKAEDGRSLADRLRAERALDARTWERTTKALVRRAQTEGLIDVAVERHESPLGTLVLAATDSGIVRIGLPSEGEDAVLDELARRVSRRLLRAPRPVITKARVQLEEYFARRRIRFELTLDRRLTVGFRDQVLAATAQIPYGETASYAQVAARAGSPRAVRAAGTALAGNPLPILVPCHRVLRSSGALGAYRGGAEAKAWLIAFETESQGRR